MRVVIIGAGVAGISCAWQLSKESEVTNVILIDELPPASLTSNKGTEGFRNFWPGDITGEFTGLLNESIDDLILFDKKIESIDLRLNGYAFFTKNKKVLNRFLETIPLKSRIGTNLILSDTKSIKKYYPEVSSDINNMALFKKCGWFNTNKYIKNMLFEGLKKNLSYIRSKVKIRNSLPDY